jgi:integrase
MSIYLRGKSWYYDFIHKGQRYTGSFGQVSRTVAKEEIARKKAEVVEGRLNPAKARKSPRFDAFGEQYLAWAKTNRRPETYRRLASLIPRFVVFFGEKKLSDLTPWHLEQYKKQRREADRQPSTINAELAALNAMLRRAQTWGKLTDHPGKGVKPLRAIQKEARFFSLEEEARVLSVSSPALRLLTQVGLLTGFRRQELAFLRPEDVSLERGIINVVASYSKNGERRTLPMGPRLTALLQRALTLCGSAATVFLTEEGKSWTPHRVTGAFRLACRRAGLGMLGPHIMRHTFASRLVMAGVDLRTVQELLGHKSILMTMRYAHLSPDHKRMAMETLESRFGGETPATFHNTPLPLHSADAQKLLAVH